MTQTIANTNKAIDNINKKVISPLDGMEPGKYLEKGQVTKYDNIINEKDTLNLADTRKIVQETQQHNGLLTTYANHKADLKALLTAGDAKSVNYLNYLHTNFNHIQTLKGGAHQQRFAVITARLFKNGTIGNNLATYVPILNQFTLTKDPKTFSVQVDERRVDIFEGAWSHILVHTKKYAKAAELSGREYDTTFWPHNFTADDIKTQLADAAQAFGNWPTKDGRDGFKQEDHTVNGYNVRLGMEKLGTHYYAKQFYPRNGGGLSTLTKAQVNAIGDVLQ